MKLISYHAGDGGVRLAVKTGDRVHDAGGVRLMDVLTGRSQPGPGAELDEASLRLAPCVPNPGKLICVGLNYRRHAAESKMAVGSSPVLFAKFGNALAASGEDVPLPGVAVQYDYEAELAVVIGRRAAGVGDADAMEHVFGYCNANDLSARDLQHRSSQWLLGKSLDRFLPLGPYLVSADEVGDPARLGIRCFLNGEKRQDSSCGDMVFGVPELVGYASRHMTLEPGDVISTGTPEGVITGRGDGRWLRAGDEVVVEIDGLGRLVNRLVAPL